MNDMLFDCSSLVSLDLSLFDTSNVTGMKAMFYGCSSLTSLDLSNFDTYNVTDMEFMFFGCEKLTFLDVGNWDTARVTDMGIMFDGCLALEEVDVSGWDTSNVTDMSSMFTACKVLLDKEDDSSAAKAFFRGFKNGFGTITVAYLIMLVLIVLVGYSALSVLFYNIEHMGFSVGISLVGLFICSMFQSVICIFHSRFSCTLWQLFRNAWLLFLAHPLRCILVCALTWSPLAILLVDLRVFLMITPIFLAVFFSFVHLLRHGVMKKPFADLEEMYKQRQNPEPQPEEN
jgi:surface protein